MNNIRFWGQQCLMTRNMRVMKASQEMNEGCGLSEKAGKTRSGKPEKKILAPISAASL